MHRPGVHLNIIYNLKYLADGVLVVDLYVDLVLTPLLHHQLILVVPHGGHCVLAHLDR